MSEKIIYGLYNDDELTLAAAKDMVVKGVKIKEVYSPFPIHGIEKVLNVKPTRLAIACFLYGLTGLTLALLGLWYFMIEDWPMNVGGKPSFTLLENLPAFIPVTFEFTVLCAAHGMAITYLIRNSTLPGFSARNPDPRTTDGHFAMEIHAGENTGFTAEEIGDLLKTTGAEEVFER